MPLIVSTDDGRIGQLVLRVRGEIRLADIGFLGARLQAAIAQRPAQLLVDLHAVSFLGSAGLACLTLASLEARTAGVALFVVGERLAVTHPIHSVGLATTLRLYPSLSSIDAPLPAAS